MSATGHRSEQFIQGLLAQSEQLINVRLSGFNATADIYYETSDGKSRGIQVKTMSPNPKRPGHYTIGNRVEHYPEDMVIVGINMEDERCLVFRGSDARGCKGAFASYNIKEVKVACPHCGTGFTTKGALARHVKKDICQRGTKVRGHFNHFKVDWSQLAVDLATKALTSTVIHPGTDLTNNQIKELGMTQRFIEYCEKTGQHFILDYASNAWDGSVNGNRVQLKHVSDPRAYMVGLFHRRDGTLGPYHEGENDYYIFELGELPHNFFIVSEQRLIEGRDSCYQ